MLQAEYLSFPGEVIILGLPAFVKMPEHQQIQEIYDPKTTFFKTSPVTKIHPNGDFETKDEFLCKRT